VAKLLPEHLAQLMNYLRITGKKVGYLVNFGPMDKQELALTLYARHKLTLIQAADLAETGFFEFQQLLRERSIPQHYTLEDLATDKLTLEALP
jgi:predicted HTH domain antitoxin